MIAWQPCLRSLIAIGSLVLPLSTGDAADPAEGWAGRLGAAWHWRLPDTPNGLKPTQSWHATGAAPSGDIYVGGMDHATNAALYRLDARTGLLRYAGDARSASEAVGNWRPGETAEKFHTRPLFLDGKMYVATMDRSTLDEAYLSRRGFHWYAYDPATGSFADLSAAEPGGSATAHGALVTLAADPARGVIYGAGVPTGDIYRYDVVDRRTEDLGRPASYDRRYVYAGRVMWVDAHGRLYFTAGNPQQGEHDPAVYGHVYYYDPATGFGERADWRLQEPRALEVGQCLPDGGTCFFADDQGHVYRFDEDGPRWSYIGQAKTPTAELWVWLFHVSANGRKAYFATSSWAQAANPSSLYEFDLVTGETRRLCGLDALDPELAVLNLHTGYDAWDKDGRFYFASFSMNGDRNVVLTRLDPVRLKAALGLLPSLTEVTLEASAKSASVRDFVVARSGSTTGAQLVLYRLTWTDASGTNRVRGGAVTIPPGARSSRVALGRLPGGDAPGAHGELSLVPDGDGYTVGARRSAAF
jgi:outer membrane protein assembly factor BamB